MKLTTLFTFLILALAMNSQAQNVIFSNAAIGEDVKESTQTEFTLGEDEIFQRAHFLQILLPIRINVDVAIWNILSQ